MTISSQTRKAGPFVGTGSTGPFAFAFKIFQPSDMLVVKVNNTTTVETTLVIITDFTVTMNFDQNSNPGGNVTLVAPLAVGYNMVMSSQIPYLQETDLTNQGGFYPEVITNSLDNLTIQTQQLKEANDRSVKLSITSSANTDDLVADITRLALSANNVDTCANNIANINSAPANATTATTQAGIATTAANSATASALTAVNAPGTSATSTTSLLVGLGSKSLTIQTAKSLVVGMTVKIAYTTVPTTWMLGDITAYNSGTGALVVTVTAISGSGTQAVWTVSLSAPGGATLGTNTFTGPQTLPASGAIFSGQSSGSTTLQADNVASGTCTLPFAGGVLAVTSQVAAGQTFSGAQRGNSNSLTSSAASIAINLLSGNNFTHTTTENTTLAAPSSPVVGQSGVIVITQGATARTLAYNAFWKFTAGVVPTLTATASAVDTFAYYVESATRATCQLIKDVK